MNLNPFGQRFIVVILWVLWLGAAVALGAHPLLFLTPLLAYFSCLLVISIPRQALLSATPSIETPPIVTLNFKHDLRTPIALIIGFCDAMLRAASRENFSPDLYLESINAVRRNAKHLDDLIMKLRTQPPQPPEALLELADPTALIKETAILIHDLLESRHVTLNIQISDPLPMLSVNRVYLRQALLNLLRSIGQITGQASVREVITVVVREEANTLIISFIASNRRLEHAVVDASWEATQRLIDLQHGRLWMDREANGGMIYLSLPVPVRTPSPLRVATLANVVIISNDPAVLNLFTAQLKQFEVSGVPDIDTLRFLEIPPHCVILTEEPSDVNLERIGTLIGKHIPIVVYPIPSPQQQLQHLRVTYLTKPIDYDTLSDVLTHSSLPVHDVLIVDDNVDTTTMLARMLASMPAAYAIKKAHTAHQASEILADHKIDAVILDVALPDQSGIDLVRQLRADVRYEQLLIIIASAHQTLEFMLPETVSTKISVFRQAGFEPQQLASQIEALIHHPDLKAG